MKNIYKKGLFMMVAGALVASCADYNVTDDYKPESGSPYVPPYGEYNPIKTYIDKEKYPNMTISTAISSSDFKAQGQVHAMAVTNFDGVSLGTGLMSSKFVRANGVKDFTDLVEILEHSKEMQFPIYGSPIAANANQADEWIKTLTSPIQIFVEYKHGKTVDYSTMSAFEGTTVSGMKPTIDKTKKALKINNLSKVNIIEGFEADPLAKYTITFTALSESATGAIFDINFCGKRIEGIGANGRWTIGKGGWRTVVVENVRCPEDATAGYMTIENTLTGPLYIQNVDMGFYPDDHRAQTAEEINDTINYAMDTWCDGLMETNAGRITSFDLIDEAIDAKAEMENGMYDLKHSSDKYFWQDIFGSENYGPKVSKTAASAYEKHGGNPADLKFFISETGLEDAKKMESLKYWIGIWEKNGAKIDGINAKLSNLYYYEDAAAYADNKAAFDALLNALIATGKQVRLSNLDIKYRDAQNKNVNATDITDAQREKLAEYYAYVIKSYLEKVPSAQQAGICKGNIFDTADPVGLFAKKKIGKNEDWVRTPAYKAFCDALSGK